MAGSGRGFVGAEKKTIKTKLSENFFFNFEETFAMVKNLTLDKSISKF